MKQGQGQHGVRAGADAFLTGLRMVCALGAAALILGMTTRSLGAAAVSPARPPAPVFSHQTPSLHTITTTHSLSGTAGLGGWFVSPVTVTLHSAGGAPGAVLYRVDAGDWVTYTLPFVIIADGAHRIEYYGMLEGETEPVRIAQVHVDCTPPASAISLLPAYEQATSFVLAWSGSDNNGSGIATYDIQYRDSLAAAWSHWLTATSEQTETFSLAERGHVYYFRVRARDAAGNVEAYRDGRGDAFTFVDSVVNGDFETGSFSGWTVTGEMSKSISLAVLAGGAGQWSALLGSPAYGSSITPTAQLHVPTNTLASISQAIVVPLLTELPAPALTLWYRIQTYDVVWGCTEPDALFDSFDVTIRDTQGHELAMPVRDGNYDCQTYQTFADWAKPLTDVSAQRSIDLSSYAGQMIVIEMHNANRRDWSYNTWTFVDDVRLVNQPSWGYRLYLPMVSVDNTMTLPPLTPAGRSGGRR